MQGIKYSRILRKGLMPINNVSGVIVFFKKDILKTYGIELNYWFTGGYIEKGIDVKVLNSVCYISKNSKLFNFGQGKAYLKPSTYNKIKLKKIVKETLKSKFLHE